MIKTIVFALFGLALAFAAQAVRSRRLSNRRHDHAIPHGLRRGRVMVNGVCQSRAGMRQERRANRRCARYSGGACVQYH